MLLHPPLTSVNMSKKHRVVGGEDVARPILNSPAASGEDATATPRASSSRGANAGVPQTVDVDTLVSLMAHFQKAQTESLKEVLDSVLNRQPCSSTPSVSYVDSVMGMLARCKVTFGGGPHESVGAFIDAVECYYECAQVPDSNIIRGLSMLLTGEAATWWQGLKHTISSWTQAKDNLTSAYGDRRHPHRVYLNIFASPQTTQNTDMFVVHVRALLARLQEEISQ